MASLQELAAKPWRHPDTGLDVRFSAATLERWFYTARRGSDPVAVLRNRKRDNVGQFSCMSAQLIEALTTQYREHPGWTMQLHFDNLRSKFKGSDIAVTSYPTIRRYLKAHGMFRKAAPKRATAGALAARDRLEQLEVRSFELDHVNALWRMQSPAICGVGSFGGAIHLVFPGEFRR